MVVKLFFDICTSFRFSDFQRSMLSVQSIFEACPCIMGGSEKVQNYADVIYEFLASIVGNVDLYFTGKVWF